MLPSWVTALLARQLQVGEKGEAPSLHACGLAADCSLCKLRHRSLAFTEVHEKQAWYLPPLFTSSMLTGGLGMAGTLPSNDMLCKDCRWVWQPEHLWPASLPMPGKEDTKNSSAHKAVSLWLGHPRVWVEYAQCSRHWSENLGKQEWGSVWDHRANICLQCTKADNWKAANKGWRSLVETRPCLFAQQCKGHKCKVRAIQASQEAIKGEKQEGACYSQSARA